MERKTNWIAIAAAVVAAMVVGFLWYGFLFVQPWAASNGITIDMAAHTSFKDGAELPHTPTPMVVNILAMVAFALILNWLAGRAGAVTWADGAKIGAAVGAVAAAAVCIGHLFAWRPSNLLMIDGLYTLIQLTLMGAIVGGWQKK